MEKICAFICSIAVSDLIMIIIAFLTLLATIFVGLSIYWMQRKHEKERISDAEKAHNDAIAEAARTFFIDNEEDIDFLPLCQIAQNLHSHHKHIREIYTKFNKCSTELQQEILKQEKLPQFIFPNDKWAYDYVEQFNKDIKENGLNKQNFLYDGGKYFHRAFERYSNISVDDISPRNFKAPITNSFMRIIDDDRDDFGLFIDQYLQMTDEQRQEKKLSEPMDIVWNQITTAAEEQVTFWVMRMIIDGCIGMLAYNLIPNDEEWRNIPFDEYRIETQEDMYYYTLLILYTTYYKGKQK